MTAPRSFPAVAAALLLPLAGLVLLVTEPSLDVMWEHHPAHFWLVLAAGGLNAALALATAAAAERRGDARVTLVSLAFLAAAGFLGLHALATPGVLLDAPNTGFAMATPVGLVVAAGFAFASSAPLEGPSGVAVVRRIGVVRGVLLGAMAAWAVVSLAGVPPLDDPAAPERASGPLVVLAVLGLVLYGAAVVRYLRLLHERPAGMLAWMAVAFALLAEAMVAVAFGRNWHATWWEWHLLMLVAFGLVAWSAQRQWHEERFSDLYLDDTAAGAREVTVLFADLAGFTAWSEQHPPREVSAMLNAYFERTIPPVVSRWQGEVDRIVGDALMAVWNRRDDQPDHARLAASAALELQRATAALGERNPGWPAFRVGVNTGEVVMTLLGAAGGRTHTAIGDAVNLAARLEGVAPPGGVAVGPETARRLDAARLEPLGEVQVKGREAPVEAFLLAGLDGPAGGA